MKLKYNHNGKTESITLSKKKLTGKRIAVRHNDENFYAPLVDAGDATASNLRTTFKGEILAVRALPPPEVENILIAPPRVSVMQGQSATAIVSAEGNEAVAGLSYSLTNPPTWITISDDLILIRPSDNDLGEAIVEVIAKDTGSDASASAAFVAEARLRPIIESLAVVPPAVTVSQGSTSTAIIQAVANSAVGGLSYSLDGAPSWVSLDQDTIHIEPTTNDTGTSTVQVVAYDTNSSARADTEFVAEAKPTIPPIINSVSFSFGGNYIYVGDTDIHYVTNGETAVVTLNADYNAGVSSIEYLLLDVPSWMTFSGNKITISPTYNETNQGYTDATVTAIARDTGSTVQASTQFVVRAQRKHYATHVDDGHIYLNNDNSNSLRMRTYVYTSTTSKTYKQTSKIGLTLPTYFEHTILPNWEILAPRSSANLNYVGSTIPCTIADCESGNATSLFSGVMYIHDSSLTSISLSPARATLATGSSGNTSVTIKAVTTSPNKMKTLWKISGRVPKNATVTPGQGFTSASTLASMKVVYPKKDQTRARGYVSTIIEATSKYADYRPSADFFYWESLTTANAMSYSY